MYFSPRLIYYIRKAAFIIAAVALALLIAELTYAPGQAIALSPGPGSAGPADKVPVAPDAVEQCPTLPAPASMSGVTELNTVKSQMWIINGVCWLHAARPLSRLKRHEPKP